MDSLWRILIQFILRLTFGTALSMAWTAPQPVTSGFFRVHLWVLMGLNTLTTLAVYSLRATSGGSAAANGLFGLSISTAVFSYVGAVCWLYEKRRPGAWLVGLVSLTAGVAAVLADSWPATATSHARGLGWSIANAGSSGLLLGTNITAMFLGHWYLNTPSMKLEPLRRLVLAVGVVLLLRAAVSGLGLVNVVQAPGALTSTFWIFVALRWLTGILGLTLTTAMTWYTLKIPNTQSATGILYAGVILSFLGELTSQLLSADTPFPV